ncbi:unnamed protein product [Alternaria alternata]|nr:hypothetical protein AALT_g390 [Alternaria alternata]
MTEPSNVPIESITYTHKDVDCVFLDRLLGRMTPLSALAGPAPQQQVLGSLAILPIELLLMVLENLAVTDVMRFRRCNRFAMHVVDTESPLRLCLQFAPNTVIGMMALRISTHVTPQQLCNKVLQRDCDQIRIKDVLPGPAIRYTEYRCGQLAQHIYLPACTRLCVECIRHESRVTNCELTMGYQIYETEDFTMTPSFRTLPVTLTNGLNKFRAEAQETLYTVRLESMNNRTHDLINLEWALRKHDNTRPSVSVISAVPITIARHMPIVVAPLLKRKSIPESLSLIISETVAFGLFPQYGNSGLI